MNTHTPTTNTRDTYATSTTTVSRRDLRNEKRCNKEHTPSPTKHPNARTKKRGTNAIRNVGRLAFLALMTSIWADTVQAETVAWNNTNENSIALKQLKRTVAKQNKAIPKTAISEKEQYQKEM